MSISKEKKNSLIGSVSVVSGATAFSRVLGLVREQVMAYFFGAGMATDAFLTAFRVPNLLRDMFAEGALSQAFIPVFKEKMVKKSDEDAFRLADVVLTGILLIVGFIVLLGILAAPVIIYLFAYGFVDTPDKFELTVDLTRWMMVYLLLVSLSAVVMGMLNSFGRFGIPALSPALFNLGIILTVVVSYRYFDQPIYSLAIGVLVGGIGQLVVQLPVLIKIGYRFRPVIDLLDEGFKRVTKLLGPMIIGLSASRINILVNTLLASFLMEGSISFLSYSYRLMHFPLGVFAVALGTVALPKVSELVSQGKREELNQLFDRTIQLNLFVIIPSAFFLIIMSKEIVDLIYSWGAFSDADAQNTSLALIHYSYGLIGFGAVRVLVPFFYAHGDSKIPMRASLLTVGVNIVLYYPFIQLLDFAGLAMATSVAGLVNFLFLLWYISRKGIIVVWSRFWLNVFRTVVAAFFAFYIAKMIPIRFFHGESVVLNRFENLFIPLLVALLLYCLFSLILQIQTFKDLVKRIKRE